MRDEYEIINYRVMMELSLKQGLVCLSTVCERVEENDLILHDPQGKLITFRLAKLVQNKTGLINVIIICIINNTVLNCLLVV